MTPILVTGGAGYIGAHVCKELAKNGFLPITYDNLSTGHAYAVKWGPFVEGDLNDREALSRAIGIYQPKAVLHFAASALVVESLVNPAKYYQNNFVSTLRLLEAMVQADIRLIVFSSTCATYGNPQFLPITEDHPQAPISPYGRTKWMIEQMLNDFEQAHQIHSVKLRYFNAAGADPDIEIGEHHDPETHLIPSCIQAALNVRDEVVVYGTDFLTTDGSAVRDYIHVQDLAAAHVRALQYLLQTPRSVAINLGTGRGYSALEIINAIQKHCGKSLTVRLEQRRPGEPASLVASAEMAKKILNWSPQISDLTTLIDSAWRWHQLIIENSSLLRSAIQRIDKSAACS
jgi:UDP-glucose-4-epimerase GalE